MGIRTFRPGDETTQVSIYNEAASELPRFKPTSLDELRRRTKSTDYNPFGRFFAEVGGRVVGYCGFHSNGRVCYPWCRKGHEDQAEPLFHAVLQAMQQQGLRKTFAAYRTDWKVQSEYFTARGFRLAREMVNFLLELADMPTPAASPSSSYTPLEPKDVPAVMGMVPQVFRVGSTSTLEQHLLHNPDFPPDSVFVLRGRTETAPLAVGVLVENQAYADPRQIDSEMPCFRLGAFGTEGMQVKRINGLFSFLARPGNNANALGLDLVGQAAYRLRNTDLEYVAAQVPSDVPHLLRFYQQYFRRQGSFPVFERNLP